MNRFPRLAILTPLAMAFRVTLIGTTLLTFATFASEASAQIEIKVLLPNDDDPDDDFEEVGTEAIEEFFNIANCECGTSFGAEFFLPSTDTTIPDNQLIEVWVGNDCANDDKQQQEDGCGPDPIDAFTDRDELLTKQEIPIALNVLVDPNEFSCEGTGNVDRLVYALIDENGDESYDFNDSATVQIDLAPPPELDEVSARGSEGGFVVEWSLPGSSGDFETFQVLCANIDGTPVLDEPADDAQFQTPVEVCNATPLDEDGNEITGILSLDPSYVCSDEVAIPTNNIRVDGLPDSLEGYRVVLVSIDKARNPRAVDLGVVVPQPVQDFWEDYKDSGGDAEGGYCFVATATYGSYNHPHVVVLREFRDSVLAQFAVGRWLIRTYYDLSPPLANFIASSSVLRFGARVVLAPIVLAAGLWVYSGVLGKLGLLAIMMLTIVLWRRRRRAKRARRSDVAIADKPLSSAPKRPRRRLALAAAAAMLFVVLGTNTASAQQEYLNELTEDAPPEFGGPTNVRWNFEFRMGPFVPDIDSEFSGDGEGPFAEMFGDGPMLMTKMSLDRFFVYPQGQLGVTFGMGFLTTGADSYALDAMGNIELTQSGKKVRVDGERTNLRLFPFTVGAVYRFTKLDDRFHVPIVPYAKLALAYTVWSITKPSGEAAEVPTAGCPNLDDCTGDVARGGSLGFDATIGLAIRAERIDPDASVGLRNEMGIEHAGFFAEVGLSQVDGFGSSTKLSVGDFTYFGGFNFEF